MHSGVKKQLTLPLMARFASAFGLRHLFAISLLLISIQLPVHSQIFSCKDAAGRTITSDRPMPECGDRVIRELSNSGVLRREIAVPLTAEEKRQLHLKEESQRMATAASDAQRQQDRALLARYRSEDEIASSRRYSISLSQGMVKHDLESILEEEKQLKMVQSETALYQNKKIPPNLQAALNDALDTLENSKKNMHDHERDTADINAKFDATLLRYRELSRNQTTATSR
ncbi:hypothetical protein ACVBEF_16380 [Glaciimonas sp. GG7]